MTTLEEVQSQRLTLQDLAHRTFLCNFADSRLDSLTIRALEKAPARYSDEATNGIELVFQFLVPSSPLSSPLELSFFMSDELIADPHMNWLDEVQEALTEFNQHCMTPLKQ